MIYGTNVSMLRPILCALSVYILSTLLPSVVFAMPNRSQTTSYVVQTLLMLMAVYCFLACLGAELFIGAHGLSQYEAFLIPAITPCGVKTIFSMLFFFVTCFITYPFVTYPSSIFVLHPLEARGFSYTRNRGQARR
jgi:hypothetical protein